MRLPRIVVSGVVALAVAASWAAAGSADDGFRSQDGSGNNVANPSWGKAGTNYIRVAAPNYADGIAAMQPGPSVRYVSNRVFNDLGQNIFSENDITQWGWTWGQFLDHTMGLRDETPGENDPLAFDRNDPLEAFRNDAGFIDNARTPAAPGTGTGTTPREQVNTVTSYLDAFNVYGGSTSRLAWLRDDAHPENLMLTPDRYLPRVTAKPNPPPVDLMGLLQAPGMSSHAIVAGDVRANENIALTATHTLFAREHNTIVSELPAPLTPELKFQIARRLVDAEEQYITYNEFLPSLGVKLDPYTGYKPDVNASISNEFAVVGYRAHSMVHGEFEVEGESDTWSDSTLDSFDDQGIEVEHEPNGDVTLEVPLGTAFGNPDLLKALGEGPVLGSLSNEREYRNDEQIDNQMRSVLFQIPSPGIDPAQCETPDPACFHGVVDLGAIDIERGRDHGMPTYNQLRQAYGLAPKTTFQAITGEATAKFPNDPLLGANPINSTHLLDFVLLRDRNGAMVQPGSADAPNVVTTGIRRTPLAARLRAIYGDVNSVDAFVGMVSEPHVPGTEFGELQLAMWKKQFQALRDGDRFFYAGDPNLQPLVDTYHVDYRKTLAQVIEANSDETVPANVFRAVLPPAPVPGLVASYGFDEGAGTTTSDESGRGNAGQLTDTTWVPGKFGRALSFNGTSSSVTIPDTGALDLTSGMTLEAWVNPTALGSAWRAVVFKEQPSGMVYSLYANKANGRPVGQVNIGGERNVNGSAALPLNTWSHLAVTYDGSQLRLYVNGALVGTKSQSGTIPVSSGPLRIGGNSIWGEWFKGAIDEVRVYDRAVTPAEILADMASPVGAVRPSPPAVLVGDQQVETDVNPSPAGQAEAFPATASSSARLQSVSVYVDAASTATSLVAGIYSDAGGHPGSLLAQGSIPAPVRGAWNQVELPPTSLGAGTHYWIALLGPAGSLAFRDRCCTVTGDRPTETSGQSNLAVLPATWSPGSVFDDGPISAFGSA